MKFLKFKILIISGLCIIAVNPLFARETEETITKSVVVFPFDFNNSQKSEQTVKGMSFEIEKLLYKEKQYLMINAKKVDLLTQILESRIFRKNSKNDTAHIGTFLNIDYIVMGDVIRNKNMTIKIVDVKRKEFIFSRTYDLDDNVKKLTNTIAVDIDARLKDYSFTPYTIYTFYSYFMPMRDLADIITNGHGAGAGFAYELPFVKNLLVGGEVSCYYLDGKTNVTHHATVMPMTARVSYRIDFGDWYMIPSLAAGTSYNALYYYTDTNISSDYIKRDSYDTTYKAGCIMGYSFRRSLSLFAGFEYGMFESEKRDNRFGMANFGVKFVF